MRVVSLMPAPRLKLPASTGQFENSERVGGLTRIFTNAAFDHRTGASVIERVPRWQ